MADAGCQIVVMEVSSQGLMLHRTAGIPFEIGIFTNIEPDHIGPAEHASFEDYIECKSRLFRQCRLGIVNADDAHLDAILRGHTCEIERFGLTKDADIRAENLQLVSKPGYLGIAYHAVCAGTTFGGDAKEKIDENETAFAGTAPGGNAKEQISAMQNESGKTGALCREPAQFDVEIDIPGKFSVYNSLTAIAICRHFKVAVDDIQKALKTAKVKGRVEMVKVSDELTTLREYHPHRLVCLFGCGGNRSKLRRYEMGEVSGRLADLTIITSDNPRYEKPEDIIADIITGMEKTDGKYVKITDRKEAIAYAIHHGEPGDIIVLAGKGHEDYQEIEGKHYPMDERVLIQEILEGR